jgi:hypothetical protein
VAQFEIINYATDPDITAEALAKIAYGLTEGAVAFAEEWDKSVPSVAVRAARSGGGVVPIAVVNDAQHAGSLGEHLVDEQGRAAATVAWGVIKAAGGTLWGGAVSLSAVASHELVEPWVDPSCTLWADGLGVVIAFEVADPVESDIWVTSNGVAFTNWVLPSWFVYGTDAPYDHMGKLTAPFTMSERGYWVERAPGGGGVREVFSRGVAREEWRVKARQSPFRPSRSVLRGVRP